MNILNNRNKSTNIFKVVALCLIAAVSFTLVSCDDDMDIQQSYPFTVEVMPVPNKVTKGQTVEIRCELKKEGDFANTLYTIRYFQFEGEGKLKMDNGITFLPNDRYLLENEKFRLYYTAEGEEAHNCSVRLWRSVPCPHGSAAEREWTGRRQSTVCHFSRGRCAARNILRAGTRKNTTHTWVGVTKFCRTKDIRHEP